MKHGRLAHYAKRSLFHLSKLSWRERRLVFEALALFPFAHLIGARILRIQSETEDATPLPDGTSSVTPAQRSVVRAVALAVKVLPFHASCLHRSTVTWLLLRRQGDAAQLRIGVRKGDNDALAAHAWVEIGGMPVNDSRDIATHYVAFDDSFALATLRFSGHVQRS